MRNNVIVLGTILTIGMILASSLLGIDVGFSLLISNDMAANVNRIIMLAALGVITFTSRPRATVTRIIFAVISVAITTYAIYEAGSYSLAFVDAAVYVLGGVILMCEALEDAPMKAPILSSNMRPEIA